VRGYTGFVYTVFEGTIAWTLAIASGYRLEYRIFRFLRLAAALHATGRVRRWHGIRRALSVGKASCCLFGRFWTEGRAYPRGTSEVLKRWGCHRWFCRWFWGGSIGFLAPPWFGFTRDNPCGGSVWHALAGDVLDGYVCYALCCYSVGVIIHEPSRRWRLCMSRAWVTV